MLIPNCYARQMANHIPNSRYMLVTEAGHNPLAECPQRVLPAMVEFLKTRETLRLSAPRGNGHHGPYVHPSHPSARPVPETVGAWKHESETS